MIHILTGPIRSGKTTALINWIKDKKDAAGILTPDVDGIRHFMNIATRQLFKMEASENEEKIVVGRFAFSKTNFEKANTILQDAIDCTGWLVLDEAGPLELNGEGFYKSIKKIPESRKEKILFVVREELVEKFCSCFQIATSDLKILNAENLPQLI